MIHYFSTHLLPPSPHQHWLRAGTINPRILATVSLVPDLHSDIEKSVSHYDFPIKTIPLLYRGESTGEWAGNLCKVKRFQQSVGQPSRRLIGCGVLLQLNVEDKNHKQIHTFPSISISIHNASRFSSTVKQTQQGRFLKSENDTFVENIEYKHLFRKGTLAKMDRSKVTERVFDFSVSRCAWNVRCIHTAPRK